EENDGGQHFECEEVFLEGVAEDKFSALIRKTEHEFEKVTNASEERLTRWCLEREHRQQELEQHAADHNPPREPPPIRAHQPGQEDHHKPPAEADQARPLSSLASVGQALSLPGIRYGRLKTCPASVTSFSASVIVGASAMIRTIGSVLLPRTISQR